MLANYLLCFASFALIWGGDKEGWTVISTQVNPKGRESCCAKQRRYQMGHWSHRARGTITLKINSSNGN